MGHTRSQLRQVTERTCARVFATRHRLRGASSATFLNAARRPFTGKAFTGLPAWSSAFGRAEVFEDPLSVFDWPVSAMVLLAW